MAKTEKPADTTEAEKKVDLREKVKPLHEAHAAYIKEVHGIDVDPLAIFAVYSTRVAFRKTSDQYQESKTKAQEAKDAEAAAKEKAKEEKAAKRAAEKAEKDKEKAEKKAAAEKAKKEKQTAAEAAKEADEAAKKAEGKSEGKSEDKASGKKSGGKKPF